MWLKQNQPVGQLKRTACRRVPVDVAVQVGSGQRQHERRIRLQLAKSLDIAGTATLSGSLDLSLINGFAPGLGDTFQFLTAASRVGEFNSILGADLGGNLAFDVLYGLNDVTLQVISTLLDGDYNGDGFVGIDDLNIVLIFWNQNVTPGDLLQGDGTGEGFVGVDDLNIVLVNWNNGTPPGEAANIPEPGTLAVLSLGVPVLLRRHRRA